MFKFANILLLCESTVLTLVSLSKSPSVYYHSAMFCIFPFPLYLSPLLPNPLHTSALSIADPGTIVGCLFFPFCSDTSGPQVHDSINEALSATRWQYQSQVEVALCFKTSKKFAKRRTHQLLTGISAATLCSVYA